MNLDYYKIFSTQQRYAAKCGGTYYCGICGNPAFYSDIMNADELLPSFNVVCPTCKKTYQDQFDKKRKQLIKKGKL